jgi:hypothetical protein
MPICLIPSKAFGNKVNKSRPPFTISSFVPPKLIGVFLKILVSNSADADARRVWREDCREVVAAMAEAERWVRPWVPSQEPVVNWRVHYEGWRRKSDNGKKGKY